jgi:hypothetical protein
MKIQTPFGQFFSEINFQQAQICSLCINAGDQNIPWHIDIHVFELVTNVKKIQDVYCIVPKSDGNTLSS